MLLERNWLFTSIGWNRTNITLIKMTRPGVKTADQCKRAESFQNQVESYLLKNSMSLKMKNWCTLQCMCINRTLDKTWTIHTQPFLVPDNVAELPGDMGITENAHQEAPPQRRSTRNRKPPDRYWRCKYWIHTRTCAQKKGNDVMTIRACAYYVFKCIDCHCKFCLISNVINAT